MSTKSNRYCVIQGNFIVNTILWDGNKETYNPEYAYPDAQVMPEESAKRQGLETEAEYLERKNQELQEELQEETPPEEE